MSTSIIDRKEPNGKRSGVWKHVLIKSSDESNVMCKYCPRIFNPKQATTSLRYHLEKKHCINLKAKETEKYNDSTPSGPKTQQITDQSCLPKKDSPEVVVTPKPNAQDLLPTNELEKSKDIQSSWDTPFSLTLKEHQTERTEDQIQNLLVAAASAADPTILQSLSTSLNGGLQSPNNSSNGGNDSLLNGSNPLLAIDNDEFIRRKPNFNEEEKLVMVGKLESFKSIIMSRSGGEMMAKKKAAVWKHIAQVLNEGNPTVSRTPHEVRKKWQNLVSAARKEFKDAELRGTNLETLPWLTRKVVQLTSDNGALGTGGEVGAGGFELDDASRDDEAMNFANHLEVKMEGGGRLSDDWSAAGDGRESPTGSVPPAPLQVVSDAGEVSIESAMTSEFEVSPPEHHQHHDNHQQQSVTTNNNNQPPNKRPRTTTTTTTMTQQRQQQQDHLPSSTWPPPPHPIPSTATLADHIHNMAAAALTIPQRKEIQLIQHRHERFQILKRRMELRNDILELQKKKLLLDLQLHEAKVSKEMKALNDNNDNHE